jgi:hypothetical protein
MHVQTSAQNTTTTTQRLQTGSDAARDTCRTATRRLLTAEPQSRHTAARAHTHTHAHTKQRQHSVRGRRRDDTARALPLTATHTYTHPNTKLHTPLHCTHHMLVSTVVTHSDSAALHTRPPPQSAASSAATPYTHGTYTTVSVNVGSYTTAVGHCDCGMQDHRTRLAQVRDIDWQRQPPPTTGTQHRSATTKRRLRTHARCAAGRTHTGNQPRTIPRAAHTLQCTKQRTNSTRPQEVPHNRDDGALCKHHCTHTAARTANTTRHTAPRTPHTAHRESHKVTHAAPTPHSPKSCQAAQRRRDAAGELVVVQVQPPAGHTISHRVTPWHPTPPPTPAAHRIASVEL